MWFSFSGADIRSVCTEAGMYAIRARRKTVTEKDFLDAVNKVIKGYQKFSATPKYMVYNWADCFLMLNKFGTGYRSYPSGWWSEAMAVLLTSIFWWLCLKLCVIHVSEFSNGKVTIYVKFHSSLLWQRLSFMIIGTWKLMGHDHWFLHIEGWASFRLSASNNNLFNCC